MFRSVNICTILEITPVMLTEFLLYMMVVYCCWNQLMCAPFRSSTVFIPHWTMKFSCDCQAITYSWAEYIWRLDVSLPLVAVGRRSFLFPFGTSEFEEDAFSPLHQKMGLVHLLLWRSDFRGSLNFSVLSCRCGNEHRFFRLIRLYSNNVAKSIDSSDTRGHSYFFSSNIYHIDTCINNLEILISNPLKLKLVLTIFKNPVSTEKKNTTITKIKWLMLFKRIITVYSGNHTKHVRTNCRVTDC